MASAGSVCFSSEAAALSGRLKTGLALGLGAGEVAGCSAFTSESEVISAEADVFLTSAGFVLSAGSSEAAAISGRLKTGRARPGLGAGAGSAFSVDADWSEAGFAAGSEGVSAGVVTTSGRLKTGRALPGFGVACAGVPAGFSGPASVSGFGVSAGAASAAGRLNTGRARTGFGAVVSPSAGLFSVVTPLFLASAGSGTGFMAGDSAGFSGAVSPSAAGFLITALLPGLAGWLALKSGSAAGGWSCWAASEAGCVADPVAAARRTTGREAFSVDVGFSTFGISFKW